MPNQDNLDNKLVATFVILEDIIYRATMDSSNTGILYLGDSGGPVTTPGDAGADQRDLLKEYLDLTMAETNFIVDGEVPADGAPWAAVVDVKLDDGSSRLWIARNFERIGDPVSEEDDAAYLVFSNDNPQSTLSDAPELAHIQSFPQPASIRIFATGNDATLIGTSARDYGAARDFDN